MFTKTRRRFRLTVNDESTEENGTTKRRARYSCARTNIDTNRYQLNGENSFVAPIIVFRSYLAGDTLEAIKHVFTPCFKFAVALIRTRESTARRESVTRLGCIMKCNL